MLGWPRSPPELSAAAELAERKWLGPWRLRRLELQGRHKLRQREVRSGRSSLGQYRDTAWGRYQGPYPARAQWDPGMGGSLPPPPDSRWLPLTLRPVLLALPNSTHIPPGLASTKAVANRPAGGARGPRLYQATLVGGGGAPGS